MCSSDDCSNEVDGCEYNNVQDSRNFHEDRMEGLNTQCAGIGIGNL